MVHPLFNIIIPETLSADLETKLRILENHITCDNSDIEVQSNDGQIHLYPVEGCVITHEKLKVYSKGKNGETADLTARPFVESHQHRHYLGLDISLNNIPYILHRIDNVPLATTR